MSNAIDVKVPDIGDFKDVPVIEVLVKPGDTVKAEDPLVTLESDKATMDVPAPRGGVVKEIEVKVGDKVSEGSADHAVRGRGAAQRAAAAPRRGRPSRASARRRRRSARPAGAGRGARSRHRRLQGRAGDRGPREARATR